MYPREGCCFVPSLKLLCPWIAEQCRREKQNALDQCQHGSHTHSDQFQRDQEEPDQRPQHQCQQSHRPVHHEQDQPTNQRQHCFHWLKSATQRCLPSPVPVPKQVTQLLRSIWVSVRRHWCALRILLSDAVFPVSRRVGCAAKASIDLL